MSVTIGSLKYQDVNSALLKDADSFYDFLRGTRIISGVKGKATVNGIDITGTLLVAADCVVDSIDTELVAKEVELDYYNLSFPVSDCDLHRTWLSAFAAKGQSEGEIFIESLVPYLREQIRDEIRTQIHSDIIAEATIDTDIAKVTLAGGVTTPALAYATVLEFVAGLPAAFKNDALDKYNSDWYGIEVSPEAYEQVASHLTDKVGGFYSVGGFSVSANKELTDNEMIAKSYRNDVLFIDDTEDLTKIHIVLKPWLSTNYIVTGVGFKGSYMDSLKIVISN